MRDQKPKKVACQSTSQNRSARDFAHLPDSHFQNSSKTSHLTINKYISYILWNILIDLFIFRVLTVLRIFFENQSNEERFRPDNFFSVLSCLLSISVNLKNIKSISFQWKKLTIFFISLSRLLELRNQNYIFTDGRPIMKICIDVLQLAFANGIKLIYQYF